MLLSNHFLQINATLLAGMILLLVVSYEEPVIKLPSDYNIQTRSLEKEIELLQLKIEDETLTEDQKIKLQKILFDKILDLEFRNILTEQYNEIDDSLYKSQPQTIPFISSIGIVFFSLSMAMEVWYIIMNKQHKDDVSPKRAEFNSLFVFFAGLLILPFLAIMNILIGLFHLEQF